MFSFQDLGRQQTRRHFFGTGMHALGWAALASLLGQERSSAVQPDGDKTGSGAALPRTHHSARAKQVIFMHMVGGPSQMDLFDHKPQMASWFGKDLPDSVVVGQRLAPPSDKLARRRIVPSRFQFARHGQSGMWVSELLPWTARMVDDLCFVRSMHTDAVNHDPAITFLQTGNQNPGGPCLGAWTSYGLGSLNQNLPTFVVLVARPSLVDMVQSVGARHWQAGYLPGEHAGVSLRAQGAPILFINNPAGVSEDVRRLTLDGIKILNEIQLNEQGDARIATRINSYEMAYRMQRSAPDLANLDREPPATFQLYGNAAHKPGSFANAALMARRLVERGVRFVQIYHNNWDTHKNEAATLPKQCRDVDQACYALIQDLKDRGLLESTLVIWTGEFGRTVHAQAWSDQMNDYGRDHHPRCFTAWMAGGGTRAGMIHGETDEFSYNIVDGPVHVRDFHATVLHLLGFDHRRLTFRHQGLDQRLTGVEPATVIDGLLA